MSTVKFHEPDEQLVKPGFYDKYTRTSNMSEGQDVFWVEGYLCEKGQPNRINYYPLFDSAPVYQESLRTGIPHYDCKTVEEFTDRTTHNNPRYKLVTCLKRIKELELIKARMYPIPSKILLVPAEGFYRHYKHAPAGSVFNSVYQVLGISRMKEGDDTLYVSYRPVYKNDLVGGPGKPKMLLRSVTEWMRLVDRGNEKIQRYTPIDQLEEQELISELLRQVALLYKS